MKMLIRLLNLLFFTFTVILLTAAIGSVLLQKPLLISSIRSNSMSPVLKRGDMVFLKSIKSNKLMNGDIIVFDTDSGSYSNKGWILHRIIGGSCETGFITKGDANEKDDQMLGGTAPVKPEWIGGKVVCIGKTPLKLPYVGYVTLWLEKLKVTPIYLAAFIILIGGIIAFSENTSNKLKKLRTRNLDLSLVYILGGLSIAIVIGISMLASSQNIILNYEVSSSQSGIIYGSSIGIMQVGDIIKQPLAEIKNNSFFPTITAITTNDKQITFSHSVISLKPGHEQKTTMTINAKTIGEYNSHIWVGMFYPFLPKDLIFYLCSKSYWLALCVVSIIPSLPIILYPIINKRIRRSTSKEIRKKMRLLKMDLKPLIIDI